jgi:HEAT repeat protein
MSTNKSAVYAGIRGATVVICLLTAGCGRVSGLIDQLEDPDVEVRRASIRALGDMGPEAKEAVGALQKALGDQDRAVGRLAAVALGKIGPNAQPAIGALTELLEDEEYAMRFSAALAIQKIDPKNEAFRPVLVKAMQTGEGGAIVAVGQMGPDAAWAVPALEGLIKHRDTNIRLLAVQTLGQIGPAARRAESSLQRALSDRDEGVREAATLALDAVRGTPAAHDN